MLRTELRLVSRTEAVSMTPDSGSQARPQVQTAFGQVLVGRVLGWLASAKAMVWPGGHQRPQRHLRLIEVLNVGSRRQLMLVSCDGERFLVCAGPDSLNATVRVHPEARATPEPVGRVPTELPE